MRSVTLRVNPRSAPTSDHRHRRRRSRPTNTGRGRCTSRRIRFESTTSRRAAKGVTHEHGCDDADSDKCDAARTRRRLSRSASSTTARSTCCSSRRRARRPWSPPASATSSTTSSPRPRRCACSTPEPATGSCSPTCSRDLHRRMPTVPFVVVGKEVSMEDTRLTLSTLPGRLAEHPETVVVLTNMFYAEAPELFPAHRRDAGQGAVVGRPARGRRRSFEFQQQVGEPRARARRGMADAVEPEDAATRCTPSRRCSCCTAATVRSASTT